MERSVINIGNSKGIRLSETILEKYNIGGKIELVLEDDHIFSKPQIQPRKNWEEAFKAMNENGDDQLVINDVFEDENFEEWT